MSIQNTRWRSLTIQEALDKVAEPLILHGLAGEERGFSDADIAKANETLDRPLPAELQAFYRRVTPVWSSPELGGGFVGFQPLTDPDLTWLDDQDVRDEKLWVIPPGECWLRGWQTARLLVIGYTDYGDWLLWCDGLEGRPTGTIVLTDHEGDDNPIVLGDSLAQWLGRYWACGFIEYSIAEGCLDEIGIEAAKEFLEDHVRLNPTCKWARDKLALLLSQ